MNKSKHTARERIEKLKLSVDLTNVSVGLWVDDPKHEVLTQKYVDKLVEAKIDLCALMIDPSDRLWNPQWDERDVEKWLKLVDPYCIETVLTAWPWPDKAQIDALSAGLDSLLGVGPVAAWEDDTEFNWLSKRLRGFASIEAASAYYVAKKLEICARREVRAEQTTFTNHFENSSAAIVAPNMDRVIIQAYGTAHRKDRNGDKYKVKWDSKYGPGGIQRWTLDRSMQIPGVAEGQVQLGCGFPLWDQSGFIGHSAEEALWTNLAASVNFEWTSPQGTILRPVIDIRGWSSKHGLGIKQKDYAWEFLKNLRE